MLDRPGVTTDEVRAEVRKRIDEMAEGGGYIAAPSHSVPYDQAIREINNFKISTLSWYYDPRFSKGLEWVKTKDIVHFLVT